MDEVTSTSVGNPSVMIDVPQEFKNAAQRKMDSQRRADEFRKQLEAAHRGESFETVEPVASVQPNENAIEPVEAPFEPVEAPFEEALEEKPVVEKRIPKDRFDKEIEKRKALEVQLQQERESRIKFETQLNMYTQAMEQLNTPKAQAPEENIDPVDEEAHRFYMSRINAMEQKYEQQNTSLSEYQVKQQFAQTVDRQAFEFAQSHPDFHDAYSHLLGVEAQKALAIGYNEADAHNFAIQQLQPLAWQAYQKGQNVAQMAYNIAKASGYVSKSVVAKNAPTANFDKLEKNMQKSYSAIDEIPGVSTAVSPEHAAYLSMQGINKLAGKGGRGTNVAEFQKALAKVQAGNR